MQDDQECILRKLTSICKEMSNQQGLQLITEIFCQRNTHVTTFGTVFLPRTWIKHMTVLRHNTKQISNTSQILNTAQRKYRKTPD